MLTAEENERLTRVGPGTPMGELMRKYRQPIATIINPRLVREPMEFAYATTIRQVSEDN